MKTPLELLREMRSDANEEVQTPITQNPQNYSKPTLAQFAVSGQCRRVWSRVLGEGVLLAADNADLPETSGAVVYRARELATLCVISPGGLRLLHGVKTLFGGEIENEPDGFVLPSGGN